MNKILEIMEGLAENGHKGQFRRDKITPYFSHPLAVKKLTNQWMDDYFIDDSERGEKIDWIYHVIRNARVKFNCDNKEYSIDIKNRYKGELI